MFLSLTAAAMLFSMPIKKAVDDMDVVTVEFPVSRIYVPTEFDSNDFPEILFEGRFPNQCYVYDRTVARVVEGNFYFWVYAKKYPEPCIQVESPFLESAKVEGSLQEGVYDVVNVFRNRRTSLGSLRVRHTESKSRDDFLYADVDSSVVQVHRETGQRYLTLFGNQNSSCHQFDLSRTSMRITASGLIEVLPILREPEEGEMCLQIWKKFNISLPIPPLFASGKYAFFIKRPIGKSFYKLDELPAHSVR